MNVHQFDPAPLPRQADADQIERAKALLDDLLLVVVPILTPITGHAGLQALVAGRLLRAQMEAQRRAAGPFEGERS